MSTIQNLIIVVLLVQHRTQWLMGTLPLKDTVDVDPVATGEAGDALPREQGI
jgi:hypothetical protein